MHERDLAMLRQAGQKDPTHLPCRCPSPSDLPPLLVGVLSTHATYTAQAGPQPAQCLQLLHVHGSNAQGTAGEHGVGHGVNSGLPLPLAESWKPPASHSVSPGALPALVYHLRQASAWLRTKSTAMYMPPAHQVVLTVQAPPQPND